jgi:predicted ArsR family transcriptional regulator
MRVLAEVRRAPQSAHKVALVLGIREQAAARVLRLALEHGIVDVVAVTPKGHPIYRWRPTALFGSPD